MVWINVDKDWIIDKANAEDGHEIGAGQLAADPYPPFPRRCTTGVGDPQNHECMWCGAPLGGRCQDPYP